MQPETKASKYPTEQEEFSGKYPPPPPASRVVFHPTTGAMTYGGNHVKGNRLDVVILARTTVRGSGKCFSTDGVGPHHSAKKPKSFSCGMCRKAFLGRCYTYSRLVMLPKSALASVGEILGSEIAVMDVPAEISQQFLVDHDEHLASCNLHSSAVVSTIQPMQGGNYGVVFEPHYDHPFDGPLLMAVLSRTSEAWRMAYQMGVGK